MKKKILKIICGVAVFLLVGGSGFFLVKNLAQGKTDVKIIAANFIGYDFIRAVTGESSRVEMILKPGEEVHNFEPTPEEIIKIKKADLFIYTGGESDEWIEKLLKDNEVEAEKTLRLMDLVELREEEGEEGEYDEHIWTSPVNAMKLIEGVREKLTEIYPEEKEKFNQNAKNYSEKFSKFDQEIRKIIENGKRKELVFGDRFPFLYLVREYGLDYYAAFSGCSEQIEASSQTISFLIKKVREDKIPVILKIELTSDKLARSIAEETGAKVLELNAAHNVSEEDFRKGTTYAEMMEKNIGVLREALE